MIRFVSVLVLAIWFVGVTKHSTKAQTPEVAQRICQETVDYIVNVEKALEGRRQQLRSSLVGKSHPTLPGLDTRLVPEDIDEWFSSLTTLRNDLKAARERLARLRQESASAQRLSTECFDLRSKAVTHYWETELSAAKYVIQASPDSEETSADVAAQNEPSIKNLRTRLIAELTRWREEAKALGLNSSMLAFNRQLEGRFNAGDDINVESSPTSKPTVASGTQVILQYHTQNITITGENLPPPEGRVVFSDPALKHRLVKASPQAVELSIYAGPKAGAKPVDVSFGGFTAKGAIKVQRIDGAIWMVERFVPLFDDQSSQLLFEFDLSLQILTQATDNNDSKDFQPIPGARVALGATGEDAQVVAVSETLDGLNANQARWLTTDSKGRIYCRVRARVNTMPPSIEARFGDLIDGGITAQNQTRPFRYASWSDQPDTQAALPQRNRYLFNHSSRASYPRPRGDSNEIAFNSIRQDGQIPKALNDLVERNLQGGEAYRLVVDSNSSVELIAQSLTQLTTLIFAAAVQAGVDKDPAYLGIYAAVTWAQMIVGKDDGRVPDLASMGPIDDLKDEERLLIAAQAVQKKLTAAVSGDPRMIARAIYAGLLLGGPKGSLSAAYDQTLGAVVDAKDTAQWAIAYVKNNPQSALTITRLPLVAGYVAATKLNTTSLFTTAVGAIFAFFPEKKEKPESLVTIDASDFRRFMQKTYPKVYKVETDIDDAKIRNAVQQLMMRGTIAALQGLDFVLETVKGGILPSFQPDLAPYAKALNIDPDRDTIRFLQFTCGYLAGFSFGYAVTFISLEVLYAVATDGVATYVKGVTKLQKAGKALGLANDALGLLSIVKAFHELLSKDNDSNTANESIPGAGARWFDRAKTKDVAITYASLRLTPAVHLRVAPSSAPVAITTQAAKRLIGAFKILSELDSPQKVAKFVKTFAESKDKTLPVLREILSDFNPTELKGVGKLEFMDRAKGMAEAINKLPEDQVDEYMEGVFVLLLLDRTPGQIDSGIKEVAQHLVNVLPGQKSDDLANVLVKARELARDNPALLKGIYEEARSWAPFDDAETGKLIEKLSGRSATSASAGSSPTSPITGGLDGYAALRSRYQQLSDDLVRQLKEKGVEPDLVERFLKARRSPDHLLAVASRHGNPGLEIMHGLPLRRGRDIERLEMEFLDDVKSLPRGFDLVHTIIKDGKLRNADGLRKLARAAKTDEGRMYELELAASRVSQADEIEFGTLADVVARKGNAGEAIQAKSLTTVSSNPEDTFGNVRDAAEQLAGNRNPKETGAGFTKSIYIRLQNERNRFYRSDKAELMRRIREALQPHQMAAFDRIVFTNGNGQIIILASEF